MSKTQIASWFTDGLTNGHRYMSVYWDTCNNTHYVKYSKDDVDFWTETSKDSLMEVYDLWLPKIDQLNEYRAYHIPISSVPKSKDIVFSRSKRLKRRRLL